MLDADSGSRRKLNLKNVTELIDDSYEDWHEGDFIIIESQTGTGKTYFIERTLITRLWSYKVLFVCNRKNLARQTKKDILKLKQYEVPATLEEIDKRSVIDNVTITTYQAIQEKILNDEYFKDSFTKEYAFYDYIILDECHYILSDSSFNNKTRLAFHHFINNPDHGAITVFMSATTSEIKGPILEYIETIQDWMLGVPYLSGGLRTTFEPKVYSSGMDYSYINPIYFNEKHMDTITAAIQNDTSDNKWLIFISNIEKQGKPLFEKLKDDAVLITKDTDPSEPELVSIVSKSKFNKKVLITTKTLDNGINIKDEKVKNIVILAWDMITFIQMLGRRRVNIENADIINLYIPLRNIHGFNTWLKTYKEKLEAINLCKENPTSFNRTYDNDVKTLAQFNDLFYRDRITKNWTVNPIGEWRVRSDIESMEKIIERFRKEGRFAFIREQLSWIGMEDTFNKKNLMKDLVSLQNDQMIEDYLSELYTDKTVMLMVEDRQELILKMNIRNADYRVLRSIGTLNSALEEMKSEYRVEEFETSRTINQQRKKYKSAWRIAKLQKSN